MVKIEQDVLLLDIGGTLVEITEPYDTYTKRAITNVVEFVQPAMDPGTAINTALDVRRKVRSEAHASLEETDFPGFMDRVLSVWGHRTDMNARDIEMSYVRSELDITQVFPDTLSFLMKARSANKRIVALTNNFSALHVETLLDRFGLRPFFDDIFISASLGLRKPSVEMMDAVFSELKVPVESAVIVGDKVEMDVEAGIRSGVATCLVSRSSTLEGQEKADYLVDTLADIEF